MSDLLFQARADAPRRLIIVLHGVGSSAESLTTLAEDLSVDLKDARVLVPDGFEPFDGGGGGRQWFSVRGVTPANRADRIAAVLPRLLDGIDTRRRETGLPHEAVSLVGFSQGAILALAAAAGGYAFGPVVAIAGRLAGPVEPATSHSPRLLLLHGVDDRVIPVGEGREAAERLSTAGYRVRFETEAHHGHGLTADQIRRTARWLQPG